MSSHAHAKAYEGRPLQLAKVIVFPSAFYGALGHGKPSEGGDPDQEFELAYKTVSEYDDRVWDSSLIIIPANFADHWIIIAVFNASIASASSAIPSPLSRPPPGEDRVDRSPFCIVTFNSTGPTKSARVSIVRRYLEFHWQKLFATELQYAEIWKGTVGCLCLRWHSSFSPDVLPQCPFQIDVVSCGLHSVYHAEVLMRATVAEALRKDAQVRPAVNAHRLIRLTTQPIRSLYESSQETRSQTYLTIVPGV